MKWGEISLSVKRNYVKFSLQGSQFPTKPERLVNFFIPLLSSYIQRTTLFLSMSSYFIDIFQSQKKHSGRRAKNKRSKKRRGCNLSLCVMLGMVVMISMPMVFVM
jgi:hypothetical protein